MNKKRPKLVASQKSKMQIKLTLPFFFLYLFTFIVTFTTVSLLDNANSKRTIVNAVNKTLDNFSLNLSLQVSRNNSVVTNEDVINYLDGTDGLESTIRAQLSAKVAQSPHLRANTVIPLDTTINSLSSYQISTFPENKAFLNLFAIKSFLINDDGALFFLRHEVIPTSYDLFYYPQENGLCSLVEKIYKNHEVIGLLVSDYYSDKLYDEAFSFSFPLGIQTNEVILQNDSNTLKIKEESPAHHQNNSTSFTFKLLRDIEVVENLTHEQIYVYDLTVVLLINSQSLLLRNLTMFIIIFAIASTLMGISYLFIKYSSNKIFDPLNKINEDIKKFLE